MLSPAQRAEYDYQGPETVYTFWVKHGPCQVTGCGHRTPIVSDVVLWTKTLTVKSWPHTCTGCGAAFDIEEAEARMAPSAPLYVSPEETPYAVLDRRGRVKCPKCAREDLVKLGPGTNKKIDLALLVHPDWLAGSSNADSDGRTYGGSAQDDAASTLRWNIDRAKAFRLLEVRGTETVEIVNEATGVAKKQKNIPIWVECPVTRQRFRTDQAGGTVPKKSHFTCAHCGTVQDVLDSTAPTKKTAPYQPVAFQGISAERREGPEPYGGRFFSPMTDQRALNAAEREWEDRRDNDLAPFWPKEALPYGLEADFWSVRRHGYTHWHTMFNHRQLLCLSILSKAINESRNTFSDSAVDLMIAAFQQYIRNQCMMTIWNTQADKLEPQFAKNNFRPKAMPV